MKGTHTGEPGTDWRLAKGPFAFSGPPSHCVGELTLVNDSSAKVKVRRLTSMAPARIRKGREALADACLRLEARLPPHREVTVNATLDVDPRTPPGRYQTTLVCGRQKEQVEVEIEPDPDLEIQPNHLRLLGRSGERLVQTLRLHNRGNLPINLGDVAMVWLRERDWIGRTLVYSLRETSPEDNYEDFANRLLQNFRASLVVPARISLTPATVLAPGEQLERSLALTLPRDIRKGRQYRGFIKINEYRIWMELHCTGESKGAVAGTQAPSIEQRRPPQGE